MKKEALPANLKELIKGGEGIDVEFKTSLAELNKDAFESICAFLNSNGGHLFLGITNSGTIEGVLEDCIQDIFNNIITNANNPQKLSPTYHLHPKVYIKENNKHILYVFVPEGSQVHNTVGQIFIRNEDGDFNITGNHDQVSNLYIRKKSIFSENKIFPHLTIGDFRADLFDRARTLARGRNPDHPWLELSNEDLLRSSGLFRKDYQTGDEGYTLAAALIFGKDQVIQNILPEYKTDAIVRIKDTNRYDDREIIRTNLIESYDRLRAFANKSISDIFYQENGQRKSLRDIIFREVIANLLIHREYLNPYPAKFIIEKEYAYTENWNRPHGRGNIDPAVFSPYPKNPVIAKFFNEIGRADELGSGVRNTYRYCKYFVEGGTPTFIEEDVFKSIIPIPFRSTIIDIEDGPKGVSEGAVKGAVKGVTKGVVEKLSGLTLTIIEKPGNRVPYYAEQTGIPSKTLEGYIKKLRDANIIEFSKGDASHIGGYYITEEFKKQIKK